MDTNGWRNALGLLGLVVTLGIAIVGWSFAVRADRRARAADERSSEALRLAQSAEERADRLEQISAERRDVVWRRIQNDEEAAIAVEHIGTDAAYDVVLTVDFDEEIPRQEVRVGVVQPTQDVSAELANVIASELARQEESLHGSGFISFPQVHAHVRLAWRSALGVPGTYDVGQITL